jgi:hypothetical protein
MQRLARRILPPLLLAAALIAPAAASGEDPVTELVPGTGVLLSQSSGSGGGGTTSSTSKTNIFSPATYVDFKRFGAEPTVTVDRYPFVPGPFGFGATTTKFRDLTYLSAPQGLPTYSQFWKSEDLAQTFRVPPHIPALGRNLAGGGGGADSYQAIGQITHKVFFVDLPVTHVNVSTSTDLGETFVSDDLGSGLNPGVDDRQWIEADETIPVGSPACPTPALTAPICANVYVSFINFAVTPTNPTLALARSTHDGALGTFVTDSPCSFLTSAVGPAADTTPTACPDPGDDRLQIAGPVVADKFKTHNVYIPFVRGQSIIPVLTAGPPWELYIAKSTDGGMSWTRQRVASLGDHNPANIFPQLAIDKAGTLYYTWSQTQGPGSDEAGLLGEQDVHYAFSTNGGLTWSPPINLTGSTGKTAVMPWLVAGDPGQLNVVYYQANTGINSNLAVVDGKANPSVWNVIFGHSNNATNTGANFSNTQITDRPNHLGQICTVGIACSTGGDRGLLDFLTVDVDHLGAAVVAWSDDNNLLFGLGRSRVSRQLAGNGVFTSTPITLQSSWPIRDHAVTDVPGDVFTGAGTPPLGPCPGMDVLAASASRSTDLMTVTLTLNGAPTAANALICSAPFATGGIWGAVFSAVSTSGSPEDFYLAYRDDGVDPRGVEAGRVEDVNATVTAFEFNKSQAGVLGGTCFTSTGMPTTANPCTIALTTNTATLGLKSGSGLYSITGVSIYFSGSDQPEFFPFQVGNSEQADAATAFDYTGTGATK